MDKLFDFVSSDSNSSPLHSWHSIYLGSIIDEKQTSMPFVLPFKHLVKAQESRKKNAEM